MVDGGGFAGLGLGGDAFAEGVEADGDAFAVDALAGGEASSTDMPATKRPDIFLPTVERSEKERRDLF